MPSPEHPHLSAESEPYVPIESLSEEEQLRVMELEEKTDEVWKLRSQLAEFYRQYRKFLPEIEDPTTKSGKRRMRIDEMAAAVRSGKRIEDLIPLERAVAAYINTEEETEETLAEAREAAVVKVVDDFANALEIYQELAVSGGAFRKDTLVEEDREIKAYYRMRWKERWNSMQRLDELRAQAQKLERLIDRFRSDRKLSASPRVIRRTLDDLREVQERVGTLVIENPEAYLYVYGDELREIKRIFDEHGRIVETPDVQTKIKHIHTLVQDGRPVFIHGELGSGKTELAKHIARTRLSAPYVQRWERENPSPDKRANPDAYAQWETRREQEAEALVISGHKGIEIEQILAARAITRTETAPPEDQVRTIAARWDEFRKSLPEGADAERLRGAFEQAHLEMYRSPVETRTVLAPFLRAMREGRPVIIDEMNAIPHHVLIVLNDLLGRRPGDMVTPPFPDEEPFRVREGFAIIATGNYKPEDGVMYVGRQQIDAAFLSRWGIVSYDYLPMHREMEPPGLSPEEQREYRRENELYQMLVTRILHPNCTATFPEGDPDEFEQLEQLAVIARNIQDVFSGRQVSTAYAPRVHGATVEKVQDVLKENVLSIRHLLPILDQWKADGFTRPLDDYIFLKYIARSDARPQEKLYLYRILKVQGDFFRDSDGWPGLSESDVEKVLRYPIEEKMYAVDPITKARKPIATLPRELRTYSQREVIERLFGPVPERKVLPREYVEGDVRVAPETKAVEDLEEQLEFERVLEDIQGRATHLIGEGFDLRASTSA